MSKLFSQTYLFLMVLMVLSFGNYAHAYKLHLILACDQDAAIIGDSVMKDWNNMKDYFSSEFGPDLDIVPLSTKNLTSESIYQAIDSMDVAGSDTVMFYYSGHGAYDTVRGSQIFTLESGSIVNRRQLLARLKRKQPQFLILVTDCCNIATNLAVEEIPMTKGPRRGLEKLFKQYSGVLDITASRIGEFSVGTEDGGFFTGLFLNFLKKNAENKNVEWKFLQDEIQPELTKMFQDMLHKDGQTYVDLGDVPPGLPSKQYDQRMYILTCPDMPIRFGAGVIPVGQAMKVVKVLSGTPAEKAGIEAGDVLLEINGSPLKSFADYDILINYSHQKMRLKVKKANGDIEDLDVFLAYE